MRRKDRGLSAEEGMAILRDGEYGVLSTQGDKYPYGVPMSYVTDGKAIYLHGAAARGLRSRNMEAHETVSFTVVGATEVLPAAFSTNYSSVIVFGRATRIEGEEKRKALQLFVAKYSPAFREEGARYIEKAAAATGVYKITIDFLTARSRR